jgi:3-hydroxyacyl-CoA dehydrogenase
MTSIVNYSTQENVAVISLNSPPVNGLGLKLRTAIKAAYEKAQTDNQIKAIVLTSSTTLFCAGADINEFGSELTFAKPSLPELVNLIEQSDKPVIAAINGIALGGGLELALACDYRIAALGIKLGLPEVSLGLIPGAGGTQRLPRLINVEKAVKMITSGKPISASEAEKIGLIDRLIEQDNFLTHAIDYANELIENNAPVKSCTDLVVDASTLEDDFFDNFRQAIARRTKGYFAPEMCIQAVEASIHSSLSDGLAIERQLFQQCSESFQARAQQHLFFAQKASTQIPNICPTTPVRDIQQVAVIGAGTMGGGIAMNFANAGIKVKLLEIKPEALQRGLDAIKRNYESSVKKGKLSAEQLTHNMALIEGTLNYQDLADVDLVIEAVFENIEIKKSVFKQLDSVCKPGAILATNTSYQDVNEIAAQTSRPQDVLGLHFFSPANIMKLLEIVNADKTADDVLKTILKLAQKIKKQPVVSGVCWGFIGNRMFEPYGREATRLVLEGATPSQVDQALTEFGCAMGFCSVIDLAGIDVGFMAREGIREQLSDDPSYQIICDKLHQLGRFGQKTGRGFYLYQDKMRNEDPEVNILSEQLAHDLNIERRDISSEEIVERTIFAMINEGARILAEGICYRSSDIDLVFVNGYGFPAWRGGPMQYADEIGLENVLAGMKKYQSTLGDYGEKWFTPAPLLEQLANTGKSFKNYQVA